MVSKSHVTRHQQIGKFIACTSCCQSSLATSHHSCATQDVRGTNKAVADIRLCRRWRHPANLTKHNVIFDSATLNALCESITSFTKPHVHNVWHFGRWQHQSDATRRSVSCSSPDGGTVVRGRRSCLRLPCSLLPRTFYRRTRSTTRARRAIKTVATWTNFVCFAFN